jgi:hypothetical protein
MDLPTYGASVLPSVTVDSYNLKVEDVDGFIGDKASKGAFWEFVDKGRNALRDLGEDPFGGKPSEKVGKRKLADLLSAGDADAQPSCTARLKTLLILNFTGWEDGS